jgi:hypothetical protein
MGFGLTAFTFLLLPQPGGLERPEASRWRSQTGALIDLSTRHHVRLTIGIANSREILRGGVGEKPEVSP